MLDYPSPAMSPYDRPIEPVVCFERRFTRAMRALYWGVFVVVVVLVTWLVLRALSEFEAYNQ